MHISISNVRINDADKVSLKISEDFTEYVWTSIKTTFQENQVTSLVRNDKYEIVGDWHAHKRKALRSLGPLGDHIHD